LQKDKIYSVITFLTGLTLILVAVLESIIKPCFYVECGGALVQQLMCAMVAVAWVGL